MFQARHESIAEGGWLVDGRTFDGRNGTTTRLHPRTLGRCHGELLSRAHRASVRHCRDVIISGASVCSPPAGVSTYPLSATLSHSVHKPRMWGYLLLIRSSAGANPTPPTPIPILKTPIQRARSKIKKCSSCYNNTAHTHTLLTDATCPITHLTLSLCSPSSCPPQQNAVNFINYAN